VRTSNSIKYSTLHKIFNAKKYCLHKLGDWSIIINVGCVQLDAIQRSQKLLEARLQDLNNQCSKNEVSRGDDAKHSRMILTEMQKALGSVVSSMVSTQDGIRSMATVLSEVCHAVNTNAGISQPSAAASTSATGILTTHDDDDDDDNDDDDDE